MILKEENIIKKIPRPAPEDGIRFDPNAKGKNLCQHKSINMSVGYQEGEPNPYLDELMEKAETDETVKRKTYKV